MPLASSQIEDVFSSKEENLKMLLSSILNLNLQHETNEKLIINVINKLLGTTKHRREGLEYLNLVINNCSSSVIVENGLSWTSHCIIKYSDDVLRELKLRVLGKIIETSHTESDFNKKFVSDFISKVLDNCIATSHVNTCDCTAALQTLTTCMKYYPSCFGAYIQKIQTFLIIFLNSDNDYLVQNAAVAFHYSQQIGPAGAAGAIFKLNYTENFHKLCRTIQKLYDNIFENEREIFQIHRSDDEVFEFQDDLTNSSLVLLHSNVKRIHNCFKFIEAMIKNKFPVVKETKPKALLEIITRGTTIHKCITGDTGESLETCQFSLLLSQIQADVVQLLKLVINWYRTNILPFSYTISKVLVDNIERSQNCDCFKYDGVFQEASYRALSAWLKISKGSLHSHFQTQLLTCILKDITPIKSQMTLTISEISGKKSHKAKRKAMVNRIISSANPVSGHGKLTPSEKIHEINICRFALTALRHMLESTRINAKSTILKDLYKSVFDSLTTLQLMKPLHPYTDAQCQAGLYQILVAFYHQNTINILPPLQTSLGILARGANDSNRFVSEICENGLRALEVLCQPICPSLYLAEEKSCDEELTEIREAMDVEEIRNYIGETGNEIGGAEATKAEEVVHGNGESEVDYDASTDELIFNQTNEDDATSETPVYKVRGPDSKHTTIEELSEKGTNDEEVEIEEFTSEPEDLKGEGNIEIEICEHPIVTAPSEDGNEILEPGSERPDVLETIKEAQGDEVLDKELKDLDQQGKASDIVNHKIQESKEQDEEYLTEDEENAAQLHEITTETDTVKYKEILTTSLDEEQQDEAISTNPNVDPIEPPAKKFKTDRSEDEDLGDIFEENIERKEDSDSTFFEDDSFVDEVKEY